MFKFYRILHGVWKDVIGAWTMRDWWFSIIWPSLNRFEPTGMNNILMAIQYQIIKPEEWERQNDIPMTTV